MDWVSAENASVLNINSTSLNKKGHEMTENNKFCLKISSVELNHLGRNQSREFPTVIAEAVSNSWDADANNVRITIDQENSSVTITDDGNGMTRKEFQDNFLRIGHSKRKNGRRTVQRNRPVIGSKGLGLLSYLFCSNRITIFTKTESTDGVDGTIVYQNLVKAVEGDIQPGNYELEVLDAEKYNNSILGSSQGTMVHLENIDPEVLSDIGSIRGRIEMSLQFRKIDHEFKIYVNDEEVTVNDLKQVSDSTEFCWKINEFSNEFIESLHEKSVVGNIESKSNIAGFIATFQKAKSNQSCNFNTPTLDLFVNGRLRERDMLRHIPKNLFLAELVYGQIHFDVLEESDVDPFTTNRERVLETNEKFRDLKAELIRIFESQFENKWERVKLENYIKKHTANENNFRTFESISVELLNESIHIINKEFNITDELLKTIKYYKKDSYNYLLYFIKIYIIENIFRKIILKNNINIYETHTDYINKYKGIEDNYIVDTKTNLKIRDQGSDVQDLSNRNLSDLELDLQYLSIRELSDILVMNFSELGENFTKLTTKVAMYRNVIAHTGKLSEAAEKDFNSLFPEIISAVKNLLNKNEK